MACDGRRDVVFRDVEEDFVKNVQLSLRWSPVRTAFQLWITALDDEGRHMRLVLDGDNAPFWEEYKVMVEIDQTLLVYKDSMYYFHKELAMYGPFEKNNPPDMEQINWLRGLVEKKLFE